jgi:hypothetical protein
MGFAHELNQDAQDRQFDCEVTDLAEYQPVKDNLIFKDN